HFSTTDEEVNTIDRFHSCDGAAQQAPFNGEMHFQAFDVNQGSSHRLRRCYLLCHKKFSLPLVRVEASCYLLTTPDGHQFWTFCSTAILHFRATWSVGTADNLVG